MRVTKTFIAAILLCALPEAGHGNGYQAALERFRATVGTPASLRVVRAPDRLTPTLVSGFRSQALGGTPKETGLRFLLRHRDLFGLGEQELMHHETVQMKQNALVRYKQTHRGIEVHGRMVSVRLDAEGRVTEVYMGGDPVQVAFDPADFVPVQVAADNALQHLGVERRRDLPSSTQLQILPVGRSGRVTYVFSLTAIPLLAHYRVHVDATSGEVIWLESRVRR